MFGFERACNSCGNMLHSGTLKSVLMASVVMASPMWGTVPSNRTNRSSLASLAGWTFVLHVRLCSYPHREPILSEFECNTMRKSA